MYSTLVRRSTHSLTRHTRNAVVGQSTFRDPSLLQQHAGSTATRRGSRRSQAIECGFYRYRSRRTYTPSVQFDSLRCRSYATGPFAKAGEILCSTSSLSTGNDYATITVSNPAKLNILNSSLLNSLIKTCESLTTNPNLRSIILTGDATAEGKPASFIGGADIKEMHSLASPADARGFITLVHRACAALRNIPVPVIARVHGLALGAGLEIMASCDLRIATRGSTFGMPEVRVGIPSVVEAALLPGLIGWGRTRRLLYLGEIVGAEEAERWGLVERVVDGEEELDEAVAQWVGMVAEAGPKAIRSQKALVKRWESCLLEEGIVGGVDAFADAYRDDGEEPRVMMRRFLDRKRS